MNGRPDNVDALPFGHEPRFSIRDRDSKCGEALTRLTVGLSIGNLESLYRAPKANAVSLWLLSCVGKERLARMREVGEVTSVSHFEGARGLP